MIVFSPCRSGFLGRSALLALSATTLLSACAGFGLRPSLAEDWEARYQPIAGCVLRVSRGVATSSLETGDLVVRLTRLSSVEPVRRAGVTVTPLGTQPSASAPSSFAYDIGAIRRFSGLTPGAHVLVIQSPGFKIRTDTVIVRRGATDTIHAALRMWDDEYRNVGNCRPRGFRHRGESACVTDSQHVESALRHARSIVSAERRSDSVRANGVDVPLVIVRDERLCERAGRAYGGRRSPPRRMVVVAAGDQFVVSDPYEPQPTGEWNVWLLLDRRWRRIELYLG